MLPGKLCIGILEEDNPTKSYFRLKPLLVETDGKFEPYTEDEYPEEGSIRIVPDKNESSRFKARMRRMGGYCVLDLREHSGENDKIRPNKNYQVDEEERNAYIVYSDVVREPAEDMIFEILSGEAPEGEDAECAANVCPGTPRVLFKGGRDVYAFVPAAEEGGTASWHKEGRTLAEGDIEEFSLAGFRGADVHIAVMLPTRVKSVTAEPAGKTEKPAPTPTPRAEATQPAAEKPWINRTTIATDEYVSGMPSSLSMQCGLNPRRNRSLQEIIEEKWRHSRVDQLGHPIPAEAMGQPVENPLDTAVQAVKYAWNHPELQDKLVKEMAAIEEFGDAFCARRTALADSNLRHELEDLEAERLKSMDELAKLSRDKRALRETLKQEIRTEEAESFAEAVEKTRAAKAECEKYRQEAEAACEAARAAEDSFQALSDGRFEEKLRDFALSSHAAKLIRHAGYATPVVCPPGAHINRNEMIERLMTSFSQAGMPVTLPQAACMLICLSMSDYLIFSGPAASDKCAAARVLAHALGLDGAGRFVEFAGAQPSAQNIAALNMQGDVPALVLIRDANDAAGADVFRGLGGNGVKVIAAVSDSGCGYPVSAEALERAFFLRLETVGAGAPWHIKSENADKTYSPVSAEALREAFFTREAEVPPALERRLNRLREALEKHDIRISRLTLERMWHFCAIMQTLGLISPAEALDLAFAQKALPCILSEARVECLAELNDLLAGMPHSLHLMRHPLPIQI